MSGGTAASVSASFAAEQINNRVGSKRNVAHHYDIGNALYALMLDGEHWQYSCAYWPDGVTTLADAQGAKLAHIAKKLALSAGQEVLDIGCGWGGMAIHLARHHDVRVTGTGTQADPWVVTIVDAAVDSGAFLAIGTEGVVSWAGDAAYRDFLGLMGLGLGYGYDLTGAWYDGVELYNFNSIDLRLSAQADYVVLNNSFEGSTQVVAGGGNDMFWVDRISGETTILGGAGDDWVQVSESGNVLDNLTFDGDGHLSEQLLEIPVTDPLFEELQRFGATGADLADNVGGQFHVQIAKLDGNNEIVYQNQLVYDEDGNQLFWNVVRNTVTTGNK